MRVPQIIRQGHFWLSCLFWILLLPAAYSVRLRPVFSFMDATLLAGWIVLSIFWSALLYQFAVRGAWSAYRDARVRLLVVIPLLLGMALFYGPAQGIVAAVAALDLSGRGNQDRGLFFIGDRLAAPLHGI